MKDFNYYKKWAINHLKKQLAEENAVKKSLYFCEMMLQKSFPVGTVREWKGKKYKKVAPGKWMRYYNTQSRGSAQALRYAIKQLEKINDIETLAKFINANRSRFSDENGKLLPEAAEIFSLGKGKAGEINLNNEKEKFRKLREEFIEEINSGKRNNTKELKEDVSVWKELIASGGYSGEHLKHLQEIVKIGEEEIKKREEKKKETEKTPKKNSSEITLKDFPLPFSKGKWKKQTEIFLGFVNSLENPNPDVWSLFKTFGRYYDKSIPFSIRKERKGKNANFQLSVTRDERIPVEQTLFFTPEFDMGDRVKGQSMKLIHELSHIIDFSNRPDKKSEDFKGEMVKDLRNVVENAKISEEEMELLTEMKKQRDNDRIMYIKDLNSLNEKMKDLGKQIRNGEISYEEYETEYKRLSKMWDEIKIKKDDYEDNTYDVCALCDIYDAISGGELFDEKNFPGHGREYYMDSAYRVREIIANVASLSMVSPDVLKILEKYQPELLKQVNFYFKLIKKE